MTIHKWLLDIVRSQTISVPRISQALSVTLESDRPCLWMMLDDDASRAEEEGTVTIRMYREGDKVEDEGSLYVGPVTLYRGTQTWHVFIEDDPKGAFDGLGR